MEKMEENHTKQMMEIKKTKRELKGTIKCPNPEVGQQ